MSDSGTVSVLAARPVLAALASRSIDAGAVIADARLSTSVLSSPDSRIPRAGICRLWEAAAEATHDTSFGVHVAETLPMGAYDFFDYVLSSAATVGDGIAGISRYARVMNDKSNLKLVIEPRCGRLTRRFADPAQQYDEFTVTLILLRSRHACGVDWRPERMTFQHKRTGDGSELARVFGCPIRFGADETELRIPRSVLGLRHIHSDSGLAAVLARYADALLPAAPDDGDLLERVAASIAHRIATQLPSLLSTAEAVRMPERTLQRRLAERGVTHWRLVDDTRRNLALKYASDARLSIGEVAFLLHFADSTAFHRAFKRWTGESPAEYRKHLFEKAPREEARTG